MQQRTKSSCGYKRVPYSEFTQHPSPNRYKEKKAQPYKDNNSDTIFRPASSRVSEKDGLTEMQ